MTLSEQQQDFTRDVVKLLNFAWGFGYEVTMGEVQRPIEMQQIYVKTGRSKTMNSQHLLKLAIDLNFFKNGKLVQSREELVPFGKFWESLNPLNRWGGSWRGLVEAGKSNFVDAPHFERRTA